MGNPLVHFDFAADDPGALAEFYRGLFDWKIEKWGDGDDAYWMIDTGTEPGGGIMARAHPGQTGSIYFHVASVDESAKQAQELGATLVVPKTEVPGMGWFAILVDPAGNGFALWEVNPDYQPPQ